MHRITDLVIQLFARYVACKRWWVQRSSVGTHRSHQSAGCLPVACDTTSTCPGCGIWWWSLQAPRHGASQQCRWLSTFYVVSLTSFKLN
jgi:hypothetical protein